MMMLKFILLLGLLFSLTQACENRFHAPNGEERCCPRHYTYAGDDNIALELNKDIFLQEVDRSPIYSCYRIFDTTQKEFFDAALQCEEDEGHLVSFETPGELEQFKTKMNHSVTFLTSGLFLENKWVWSGANKTFDDATIEQISGYESLSCLTIEMYHDQVVLESNSTTFMRASCFNTSNYVCEVRVQTVTYYAWFLANWFSVLMVFLVFILMVSLCVSATMHRRGRRYSGRVYRASSPVFNDQPPSYNRATGNTTMNRYLNRGRDFLSRSNNSNTQNEKARMANEA